MAAKKDCLDSDTLPLWLCMVGSEAVCGGLIALFSCHTIHTLQRKEKGERERDVDQTELFFLSTLTSRKPQSGRRRPVEKLSLVDSRPRMLTVDAVDAVNIRFY